MAAFIQDVPTRNQFTAAAAQTIFDYTFPIFDQVDLVVEKTKISDGQTIILVLTTDYTVTGVGAQAGGTIVLTSSAAAGDIITITRQVELKRITDFSQEAAFNSANVNLELNRIVQMEQDRDRDIAQALRIPDADVNSPANDIDDETIRADKVLAFDPITSQPKAGVSNSVLQSLITTGLTLLTPDPIAVVSDFPAARLIDGNLLVGGEVILITSLGRGGHFVVETLVAQTDDDGITLELTTPNGFVLERLFFGRVQSTWYGIGGGVSFDDVNFAAFLVSGPSLQINAGRILLSAENITGYDLDILFDPGAILDYSTATNAANFTSNFCFNAGNGTLTALPALSASPVKGAFSISFVSAPAVVQGDVINFNDPTASSYNGARTNYRKGEFARVVRVTGTTVLLDGPLYDGYDHTVIGMNKVNGGTVNMTGRVEIIGVALNLIATFRGFRLIDSYFNGVSATNSRNAELSFTQCFHVNGENMVGQQVINSGVGLQYGISVANCQHLYMRGTFSGTRHGSTVGGDDEVGAIVNSDVRLFGQFSATDGNLNAADHHGNVRHSEYNGNFMGGIVAAGADNTYRGYASARPDGIAVLFTEMKNFNHDLSGLKVFSNGDPLAVGRGVIDVGGNDNAFDVNTTEGGTLNLSGTTMDAPNAGRLLSIRNRGAVHGEPMVVNLDGSHWKDISAASPSFLINKVSGDNISLVTGYGIKFGDTVAYSISGIDEMRGWEENKTFNQVTVGGAATESFAIVFDEVFPFAPTVMVQPEKAGFGSGILSARATTVTTTGFTLVLFLESSANLPASNSDIMYQAASGRI